MPHTYLCAVRDADQHVNPLFRFLGAVLTHAENGEAAITLPVTMNLCQGAGVVAGGILATLADEAMAHACISMLKEGQNTVTAEMNIRYLRATDPKKGGCLTATAKVVKPGRNLFVTEASIHDAEGRLLASAGGTFWVLDKTC